MKILAACLCLLSGCALAPSKIDVSLNHASHPFAGWPFSDRYDEDGLTEARVSGIWGDGCLYVKAGIGYNLRGKNGGGFYGPPVTGSLSVGCTFDLKRQD